MRVLLLFLVFACAAFFAPQAAAQTVVCTATKSPRCNQEEAYNDAARTAWEGYCGGGSGPVAAINVVTTSTSSYRGDYRCTANTSFSSGYSTYHVGCPTGSAWDSATNTCKLENTCPSGEIPDPANPGQCLGSDDCLARNASLTTEPVVKGFASKCIAGCQLKAQSSTVGVDGMYTASFQYSGSVCTLPQDEPETPKEEAEKKDTEKCQDIGSGYKSCLRSDGKQCITMKNGQASCWAPGETGLKTDGNAAQKRDAGTTATPPNAQLPSGDTLVQDGPTKTSTTTKTDANGNTIVINTTVTNYGTQHNTNAGTTNQGTTNTGASTNGGGGYVGGAPDGEGEEDGTSASGGGDCKNPPIVSGDAALNMVANQAWHTRCAVDAGNAAKVTGDVGNCAQPYTVEGTHANAEQLRALRAQICGETFTDLETADKTDGTEGFDIASVFGEEGGEPGTGVADLDASGFGFGNACPAPPEFFHTVLDTTDFCTLLSSIGLLVAAIGMLHATYIVRGL
jgi:hypothetical protein